MAEISAGKSGGPQKPPVADPVITPAPPIRRTVPERRENPRERAGPPKLPPLPQNLSEEEREEINKEILELFENLETSEGGQFPEQELLDAIHGLQ